MIKDINNPTDLELEAIIKELFDYDNACGYCNYNSDCSGDVTNHGSGPTYPPCADSDFKKMFNYELYVSEVEE